MPPLAGQFFSAHGEAVIDLKYVDEFQFVDACTVEAAAASSEDEHEDWLVVDDEAPQPRPKPKPKVVSKGKKFPWPVAVVSRYNATELLVRCPYCGFLEAYKLPVRKKKDHQVFDNLKAFRSSFNHVQLALCNKRLKIPYRICFPGDQYHQTADLGWEALSEDRDFPSHVRTFESGIAKPESFESPMYICGINSCRLRRFRTYRPTKAEKDSDADVRSTKGRTQLMLTARKGDIDAVQKLLDTGAMVNARDKKRQTALMHAAIKGHLEIAILLMKHGARPRFLDFKHRSAVDLMEHNNRNPPSNSLLSNIESNADANAEQHEPKGAQQTRDILSVLLGGPPYQRPSRNQTPAAPVFPTDPASYRSSRPLDKSRGNIELQVTMATTAVDGLLFNKTFGLLLNSNPTVPPVYTTSGHKQPLRGNAQEVDKNCSARITKVLSKQMGVKFSAGRFESYNGIEPGMELACHAEKHLMSDHVMKHRFLDLESQDGEVSELDYLLPPLGKATILIDHHRICKSCADFQSAIENKYRLYFDIQFFPRGYKVGKNVVFKDAATTTREMLAKAAALARRRSSQNPLLEDIPAEAVSMAEIRSGSESDGNESDQSSSKRINPLSIRTSTSATSPTNSIIAPQTPPRQIAGSSLNTALLTPPDSHYASRGFEVDSGSPPSSSLSPFEHGGKLVGTLRSGRRRRISDASELSQSPQPKRRSREPIINWDVIDLTLDVDEDYDAEAEDELAWMDAAADSATADPRGSTLPGCDPDGVVSENGTVYS